MSVSLRESVIKLLVTGGTTEPFKTADQILALIGKCGVKEENHCKDCCCAKSWEALGIKKYDGLSIPEHISALKAELFELKGGFTPTFSGEKEEVSDCCYAPVWTFGDKYSKDNLAHMCKKCQQACGLKPKEGKNILVRGVFFDYSKEYMNIPCDLEEPKPKDRIEELEGGNERGYRGKDVV